MIRRFILLALLALSLSASAYTLSTAQLQALKSAIAADPALNGQPQTPDGAQAIADALNLQASPSWTVWKTNVSINAVGKKFNGTELAGLTSGNQTRLQTIAQYLAGGVNPALSDNRAFFDDVFSGAGGTTTRANLLALWKRLATRFEKIYTSGTGSDASPAALGQDASGEYIEGIVTYQTVQAARAS